MPNLRQPSQPASRFQARLVAAANDPNSESFPSFDGSQPATHVSKQVELSDADLESAYGMPNGDDFGVEIRFTDDGSEKFATFTRTHLNQQVALIFDGKVLCAPIIQCEIHHICFLRLGSNGTRADADDIATKINQMIDDRIPATQPSSN